MKNYLMLLAGLLSMGANAQNIMASAELEAENVDEVAIEGSFVDVYVKKGDMVYFEGIIEGNGDEGDYRFDVDIVGSTLEIKVLSARGQYGWKNRRISKSRIDVTITDGVMLDIDNSSGDIHVANLRASESRIEASSGDIELQSIVANLDIETSSGSIEINGLVGDSQIESTSGDQWLNDLKGNIVMQASSGDITVDGFDGMLDIEATSGDIEIRKGEGTVEIRTTSGEIEGENILLTGDASFDATSGSIEIDFINKLSELSFDLRATSGELEVGSRSADKRLLIDRGGYKIVGVTSSGDQEYD